MSSATCGTASLPARKLGIGDLDLVMRTVRRLVAEASDNPSKPIHGLLDAEKAWRHLWNTAELWLVEGYLVAYQIGAPWYSHRKVLSDLLLVRVETGGTLAGVTRFLREQARAAGADLIALGTMLAPRDAVMSRLYQAQGFTPAATLLTMEP